MDKDNQIDMITELLIDFDEMGFAPTTLCPDPEAYAIEWRKKLTEELKGYRKASEFAREIDDLRRYIILNENIAKKCKSNCTGHEEEYWRGKLSAFLQIRGYLDTELKKKYLATDTNDGCKEGENDNDNT